jgi:hypothetical protein
MTSHVSSRQSNADSHTEANSRRVVPYIVSWSAEETTAPTVIERRGLGIGYLGETLLDRDEHGVLWRRTSSMHGRGHPEFGKIHPLRQRRAQHRLLCGICAGLPDRDERGVLWLVRDFRDDWPNWPEHMAATEPPICLPCARLSIRVCPSLRQGFVALRVGHSTVAGVRGLLYRSGIPYPVPVDEDVVAFCDPRIRWTLASNLVRELTQCSIVEVT